jgi:hypothetical protein
MHVPRLQLSWRLPLLLLLLLLVQHTTRTLRLIFQHRVTVCAMVLCTYVLDIIVAQIGKQRLSPGGILLLAHVGCDEEFSQTYVQTRPGVQQRTY